MLPAAGGSGVGLGHILLGFLEQTNVVHQEMPSSRRKVFGSTSDPCGCWKTDVLFRWVRARRENFYHSKIKKVC